MNRLTAETSPYLRQHADNPVDWWPWSPEAFDEARRRDVPVLLSVGYAACHWCHVMAHESFEDAGTADVMNRHFVNIKVDREERPDVDAVYMEATQAMTGHGGWPMTCFLTPDGEPFYCGTYFPPAPRPGMPSFPQLLEGVRRAWTERRDEVTRTGAEVVEALAGQPITGDAVGRVGGPPGAGRLDRAVQALGTQFDEEYAGFGDAPKFPPSMVLEFLLARATREPDTELAGRARSMAERTLTEMTRGGMYDQLGGGFARYSVDRQWNVPHFEKMLYDNALLLGVYVQWYRIGRSPFARRIAVETADFMLRELRTAEGGFAASLDADSEGREGTYYVWTPEQLRAFPGAAELFGVTEQGTFEAGTSVLQLREDPADWQWYTELRAQLLALREQRIRPDRDDKVVAGWNGMAISALAGAGAVLGVPAYVRAAVEAADLMVGLHTDADGRLTRTSRAGRAGSSAGVLEDYAHAAEAYLALHSVTGDPVWSNRADGLLEHVLTRFGDGRGGFFDTASDAEVLVKRPQDPTDGAVPSAQSTAAGALSASSARTGSVAHRAAAEAALEIAALLADRAPRAAGRGLAVAEAMLAGPLQIAVVGEPDDPATAALFKVAVGTPSPGAVVLAAPPDVDEPALLAGRGLVGGRPAAYVCRGFVCDLPATDPAVLASQLDLPGPD